jgi:6-phosphofructokinase
MRRFPAFRCPHPPRHQGGTILGSSRGGFDLDRILESVQANGINIVFVIGA